MKLRNYEEIIGTLADIKIDDRQLTALFTISKSVKMPFDKRLLKQLDEHIGEKIGLLNLEGEYKISKHATHWDNAESMEVIVHD